MFSVKLELELLITPFSSRRAFCSSLHFLIFSGSSLTGGGITGADSIYNSRIKIRQLNFPLRYNFKSNIFVYLMVILLAVQWHPQFQSCLRHRHLDLLSNSRTFQTYHLWEMIIFMMSLHIWYKTYSIYLKYMTNIWKYFVIGCTIDVCYILFPQMDTGFYVCIIIYCLSY